MKPTLATTALLLAGTTTAQFYNVTSAPFHLVLSSNNKTIDGQSLAACHTGAAIESLCLTSGGTPSSPRPLTPVAFNFNTSAEAVTANASLGTPGILTYNLPANPVIPSAVRFSYDPTTNAALPLLEPGDEGAQQLAFDEHEKLNVQGYIDYSANPPKQLDGVKAYYRWYACETYFLGYQYRTLVWGLGRGKPENPTCVKVGVKRVWVKS
jgi:hypothetical protein